MANFTGAQGVIVLYPALFPHLTYVFVSALHSRVYLDEFRQNFILPSIVTFYPATPQEH